MANIRIRSLIVLLLISYRITAQNPYTNEIAKANPVTPNAAALFKVEQRPVGTYTGTTPINIPLYTVSAGGLQVPISLNYHNGGIKVQEVASWVGLGWNLSAGGRITRVVNGTPDDYASYGGFLHGDLLPSDFPGNPYLPNVDLICKNLLDVEPDLFYYSFNGQSGKFYFDEAGEVHLMSQAPIDIEPVWQYVSQQGDQIKGWIIQDERGRKYYFGMNKAQNATYVDYTTSTYSSSNGYTNIPSPLIYSSSWHLAEMYDMNEENNIVFTYGSGGSQFQTLSGAYMRTSGMSGFDCLPSDSYGDEVLVTTLTQENILSRITGANGSVEFVSSSGRMDLGGVQLDDIKLFSNDNTTTPISRYHLNYGYFVSPGANPGNDEFRKRLKLLDIAKYESTGTDNLKYTFEYIENVNLPSRLSRAIDYWGFYNGQTSNWTFLPNGVYEYGIYSSRRSNLADRRAHPSYSIANTLKKITYPTGGYREFVYEGNQILRAYQSQILADNNYYNNKQITADESEFHPEYYPNLPAYQTNFTVNSTDGGTTFNFYLNGNSYGSFNVKISEIYEGGTSTEVMDFPNQYNGEIFLSNGNYRLDFYFDNLSDFSSIEAYWKDLELSDQTIYRYGEAYRANNMNAGGIRVAEVRDYDPATNKTETTKYEYNLFSNTDFTSGLLINPVRVAHVGGCQGLVRDCMYIRLSSTSQYPLASEGGSYVVYPEVRTIEEGNGYINREYSFVYDAAPSSINMDEFPIIPPQDRSWARNKLVVEKIYNENDQLVKKTSSVGLGVYSSEWGPSPPSLQDYMHHSQIGWKVVGYYDGHVCDEGILCMACWNQYSLNSYFTATTAAKEIMYSTNGNLEKLTEFEYYSDKGYPVLKKQKIYLNNGDIKEAHYKYAFNDASEFVLPLTSSEQQVKGNLLSENYLKPIEIATYLSRDGQLTFLEGTKHIFDDVNGMIRLAGTRHYTTLTTYTEVSFSKYDAAGNLIEIHKTNGLKETYRWNYDWQYLIARVVNAASSQILHTSFEGIGGLADSNSKTGKRIRTSNYNFALSSLTPGKYTLSYWKRTSGTWSLVTNEVTVAGTSYNTSIPASSTTPIDEVRFYPADAQMSTYTYKPLIGLTSKTGPDGISTIRYEYDNFGRLYQVKDQDGNVLKEYKYNYSNN